jgi:hypothetical protein
MAQKRYCVTCNKYVDIVEVIAHEDYDEQKFSCSHTGRRINRVVEENISVTDELNAISTDHRYGQLHRTTE